MSFKLIFQDKETRARCAVWQTAHGKVYTPAFFPVATQAAVKGLGPKELKEIGIQGLLVNAYHLFLRPGEKIIKQAGGLHKFMNFDKTIITDSGGYQIFSLNDLRTISDEGVKFKSHIDGSNFFLTAPDIIRIQLDLNSDVILPLDECTHYPVSEEYAHFALERTLKWAKISRQYFDRHKKGGNLFFGIVQGSTYPHLRKESVRGLKDIKVDGFAVGGLSIGEPSILRYEALTAAAEEIGKDYLIYFMGYGKPLDILEAVERGVDLFDCIVPTRFGRTGTAFTNKGKIVVRNAEFARDSAPLDADCPCYVCRNFSRAYLRHLINSREVLGIQLLTYHNIFWYKGFLSRIREAIKGGNFSKFKRDFKNNFIRQ